MCSFVLIRLPLCTQVPGGCRSCGGSRQQPRRSYGIPFIVLFNVLAVFTEIVVYAISLLFLDTLSNRFLSPVTLSSGNTRYAKIWYQLETINLEPSVKNLKLFAGLATARPMTRGGADERGRALRSERPPASPLVNWWWWCCVLLLPPHLRSAADIHTL